MSSPHKKRPFRQRFLSFEARNTLTNSQADARPSPSESHKPVHRSSTENQRRIKRLSASQQPVPLSLLQPSATSSWYPQFTYPYGYSLPLQSLSGSNDLTAFLQASQGTNRSGVRPCNNYQGTPYMNYTNQSYPLYFNNFSPDLQKAHFPYQNSMNLQQTQCSTSNSSDNSETEDKVKLSVEKSIKSKKGRGEECVEARKQSTADSCSSYEASKSSNTYSSNTSASSDFDSQCNQLLAAVGIVAADTQLENGEIDLLKLDWEEIANRVPGQTSNSCLQNWAKKFANHRATKLNDGVVIFCDKLPAKLEKHERSQSVKHSLPSLHQNIDGSCPEPNSNESSGNQQHGQAGSNSENSGSMFKYRVKSLPYSSQSHVSSMSDQHKIKRAKRARRPWSLEEKNTIISLQRKFGNKWTLIAETMGTGRTGTEVKNFWHNKKQKLAMMLLKQQE